MGRREFIPKLVVAVGEWKEACERADPGGSNGTG